MRSLTTVISCDVISYPTAVCTVSGCTSRQTANSSLVQWTNYHHHPSQQHMCRRLSHFSSAHFEEPCSAKYTVFRKHTHIFVYSVSQKKSPPYGFLNIFPKRLGIFNQFFTHLLYNHFYTRWQIFIQISPTLTKLCHTKCDHLANFYISLELLTSKFAYWANDVIIDVMSYPTCLLTL